MSLATPQRIEYIDALRGFTMILVVFQHVATFCWHVSGLHISVHDYFLQVRMPLFFFISGFVLYKAGVVWNGSHLRQFFKKKIPVQLLSPFLFFIVYIHVKDFSPVVALCSAGKMGYWFTFVLFEFFVIYAVVKCCFRQWGDRILLLLGLGLTVIGWPPLTKAIPLPEWCIGALSISLWHYFLYFVLGTLVKKHFSTVQRWLDSRWLLAICILIYFFVNGFRDVIPPLPIFNFGIGMLLTLTGLTVLFSFFRIHQDVFSREKRLGRCLQYVGRRTLDVYLIHYFFIPFQLSFFTLFTTHPMPIIEAVVSMAIALLIVAGCLLVGNVLRLSPVLAQWLFGARPPKQTHLS